MRGDENAVCMAMRKKNKKREKRTHTLNAGKRRKLREKIITMQGENECLQC